METDQLKERRKAQALEGITLLAEAAKDLWRLFKKFSYYLSLKSYFVFCKEVLNWTIR